MTLSIRKFIFALFALLLPTQLAYHLWLPQSLVWGIRVDYLAVVVYPTDLLIIALIFLFGWSNPKRFWRKLKPWLFQRYSLPILVFVVANIYFATAPVVSIFKWTKILEMAFLVWYLANENKFNAFEVLVKGLAVSLVGVFLIGLLQITTGNAGLFYWLGERSFNISTAGIAKTNFFGTETLRAYSVFSHPNSLGGFAVVAAFLINRLPDGWLKRLSLSSAVGSVVVSFSQSAMVAFLVTLFLTRAIVGKKMAKAVFPTVLLLSLVLPWVNWRVLPIEISKSLVERFELAQIAGKEFLSHPLVGVGAGNFYYQLPQYAREFESVWLLQPVHNIYLLSLAEGGVLGLVLLVLLFVQGFKYARTDLVPPLVLIVLTGALDHYWLTLQQNILLLAVIFGAIFMKSKFVKLN